MIEFQPIGPLWQEIAVFTLTALVFGYSVYATRYQALRLRLLVSLLRLVLLGFGLALLHNPTWTHQQRLPQERRMAVLVDRSGSMAAESDNHQTRFGRAYQALGALKEDPAKIDVYEFDQSLSEPKALDAPPGKVSGNKTDFSASLSQLFAKRNDYEAVVMLSDGHDLGRFSEQTPEQTKQWLERLGAPPINTVLTGDTLTGPEIAIHSIEAPAFSFVRAPLQIRATILVRNLDNHHTQVKLLEGDKVLQFQDLNLDAQGFGTVSFEVYPETQGEHLYTLDIEPHHLETQVENNRQQVLVEIGRDKINVLHISGSVTWDLQGLRAMFERNPMVDLTAFYIMRTRDHLQQGVDNRMIPPDEMALVPFPTEEIFDRQLFGFDVVVFQDFDAGTYFSDSYQARRLYRKLREYVTEHRGGLIMIGGPRTAGGPSLGLTPLADILPLVPPIHRVPYTESMRTPKQTEQGTFHPILRNFDPYLQRFDGAMAGLTEHKNANTLVRDGSGIPLLATAQFAEGRTLFLNTSSSWKWRRDALAGGKTGSSYYDFWEQTLKWVIGDPSMDQVRITATKSAANPLAVDIDVLLRNRDFKPADNTNAVLTVTSLDGKTKPWELPYATNREGLARAQFTAPKAGYYRIEPKETAWKSLARPETVFLGGSQDELRNQDLVAETLQRLASQTGGQFFATLDEFNPASLKRAEVRERAVTQTKRLKLRNWIWCLPLLLLIGALEWAIRRSQHLA